jgi:hypothetical protein
MRLFNPQNIINSFSKEIDSLEIKFKKPIDFNFYLFGDSVRKIQSLNNINFLDYYSYFPFNIDNKETYNSKFIILISDGNFSNTTNFYDLIQDKSCYYVELPPPSPLPYLSCEILSKEDVVNLDSTSKISLKINGFNKSKSLFNIYGKKNSKEFYNNKIEIDSGYYSKIIDIRLPTSQEGKHIYFLSIVNNKDSLKSNIYFVQTVIPNKIKTKIVSYKPSLDNRFINNILKNDQKWDITKKESERNDVLFVYNFTDSIYSLIKNSLKNNGVIVYWSGKNNIIKNPVSYFSILSSNPDDSFFLNAKNIFHPPAKIFEYDKNILKKNNIIINCIIKQENKANYDTLPFIISGHYKNHPVIAVNADGIWQMDFLSLSLTRENENYSMWQYIINLAKEKFISNLFNNMIVYPSISEIHEADSIPMLVNLPKNLNEQILINKPPKIHCIIKHYDKTIIDSSFELSTLSSKECPGFKIPPLKADKYYYTCNLLENSYEYKFSDTLFVSPFYKELFVTKQNKILLNEFACGFKTNELEKIINEYHSYYTKGKNTVMQILHINKNWFLLICIFVILSLEWIIRKQKALD